MWRLILKLFRKKRQCASPIVVNVVDEDYVKDFCYNWSIEYPIDRWWRNKHKVAFNSPEHRSISFLDMRFEWEEDRLFKRNRELIEYIPDTGQWMREDAIIEEDITLTEEERRAKYIKEFEKMDLSQYND